MAAGTYYIGALADAGNAVAEGYEGNNASNAVQVTVVSGRPDLQINSNVTLGSANAAVGASDTIQYYVTNQGSSTAAASHAGIYLSSDATITTADTLLTSSDTPSLTVYGSGKNYDFENATFTLPSTMAPGTYYVGVVADNTGLIAEGSEANNSSAGKQITVTAPPPTITLSAVAGDNVVNKMEATAGLSVSGTTTTVADGGVVTLVLKTAAGAIVTTQTVAVYANAFSLAVPASSIVDGAYTVTANVSTSAGNAPEASRAITVDVTPPAVSFVQENATYTGGQDQVQLIGTVEANSGTSLEIFDGSTDLGAATVNPQTTSAGHGWSFGTSYSAGSHSLRAVATDAAGNVASSIVAPNVSGDTTAFAFTSTSAQINKFSGGIQVVAPDFSSSTLRGIRHLVFTDKTVDVSPTVAHDFDGDARADILYRQDSSGNTVLAQLNGSHAAAPSAFTDVQLGPDWKVVSTASDFNNNGHADILFRNVSSGATILSEMNGAHQAAPSAFTDVQVNNSYAIAGTDDFNGDGYADILYRNVASGQTVLSELNGPHQAAPSAFTDVQLDNLFAVAGTGDFNGDGKADILYRKASSGSTLIAFQDGSHQAAPSAFTDVQVGNDYKVWVADFDGDGKSDLLFRNVNTGQTAVALMNGSHQKAPTAFTDVQLNNQFEIAQVSDFNGDGTADILFRNATSGSTLVAFMNGAHQAAPSAFTDVQVDHSWSIV